MSADNGYILRRASNGEYVIQMYFASGESYPDVEEGGTRYPTLEAAILDYNSNKPDSEYGLHIDIPSPTESEPMQTQTFVRKPFKIEAVQVTEENMEAVAKWCNGRIEKTSDSEDRPEARFVKITSKSASSTRTRAFAGDWVSVRGKVYMVYSNGAFTSNYDPDDVETPAELEHADSTNVFDSTDVVKPGSPVFNRGK